MAKTAIIFDLDDTLYKECNYRKSGWHTVARCFAAACNMTPEQLYDAMEANPSEAFETVQEIAAKNGVEVTIEMQLNIYRAHRPNISLDEEAKNVLTTLRAKGISTGIITDGRALGQLNKIAALGIAEYVDPQFIMPTVLYNTDKHSDTPFKIMMERMPDVDKFMYVGDNPSKDFHHPNLLGWKTVMLTDVNNVNIHPQDLSAWAEEYHPQRRINTLNDILKEI